jgi:hypothetical protein
LRNRIYVFGQKLLQRGRKWLRFFRRGRNP